MATKRVSVSGLPTLSSSDLINDPSPNKTRTSFLVSSRRQLGGMNTSYQLDYSQLYTAISSQIIDQLGLNPNTGSPTNPIYINASRKFTASNASIGDDGQYPVTLRGGVFGKLPGIGTDTQPVYVNSYGRLTSSAGNAGNEKAGSDGAVDVNNTTRAGINEVQPIYMKAGVLKGMTTTVGYDWNRAGGWPYFQPIWMQNGYLKPATTNIGSASQPMYMNKGTMMPCTGSEGSSSRPIYLENGTFKAISENVGDADHGIYMSGGQFYQCSPSVTPIGFNKFEPVATVVIADNSSGDSATEVSNTDLLRVAALSVYNGNKGGADGIVDFYIEHGGWYLIYAETQATNASGVLVRTNGDANWKFWNSTVCKYFPKIAYYNKTVKSSMCALINVTDNCVIGVHPNITAKDDDPFEFFNAGLKWTDDIPSTVTTNSGWQEQADGSWTYPYNTGAVFNKARKGTSTDKQDYKVVSSGAGSFANPYGSLDAVQNWWKSTYVSYNDQKAYVLTTPTYFVYKNGTRTKTVGSGANKKTYTVDKLYACGFKYKSGKIRSFDLATSSSTLWSNKDTVYLIKCSRV